VVIERVTMSKPMDAVLKSMPQEIQRAYVSTKLEAGHNFCPACKQSYTPAFPTKEQAFAEGNADEREQWITGICSSECWDKFLGV
jgi:hypothetical protein